MPLHCSAPEETAKHKRKSFLLLQSYISPNKEAILTSVFFSSGMIRMRPSTGKVWEV
jgi:hypothetical protein